MRVNYIRVVERHFKAVLILEIGKKITLFVITLYYLI